MLVKGKPGNADAKQVDRERPRIRATKNKPGNRDAATLQAVGFVKEKIEDAGKGSRARISKKIARRWLVSGRRCQNDVYGRSIA
jgi:hypothetical protein